MTCSKAYATAAFQFAQTHKTLPSWLSLIEQLEKLHHQSFKNPSLKKEAILQLICSEIKLDPHQEKWLSLIIKQRHLYLLGRIGSAFHEHYRKAHNITVVKVITAHPLNTRQQTSIHKKIAGSKKETIQPLFVVKPEIVGGIQLEYNGKLFDHSFAQILNQLRITHQE